ncbi:arabinan endo-1,5-alpha-L-arabinosidase [Carboxylicivirga linearis]|uniref:Arabinan endo-1,5-alpha-L-arabinosidase n=1 Tax=Carboxylicivirga linearis TaxID=1628157 RepID=A0ABS5JY06_9BACT|nr:arabinan endo-1,5-alpha-L-arabinosidase [Carboxylicivirga linearis]MBS2099787.1 arabinan endo-1,5-alpha-L-arabinosidase [Carboxylicivirga linearis]
MKKFIWGLSAIMIFAWIGCSDSGTDPKPDPDPDPDPDPEYVIPTYNDDYTWSGDDIASWNNRSQWNLANVHDPSVAYYKGYYYMYNTDASFGNEHEGHGHFQGKRSTDLVNWEWIGGPFYDPPAWVADSLNNIRSRMGLDAIAENDIQYGYWAPVVRKITVGGQEKLRMYYSIIIDNYIKTGNPISEAFDGSWTERAFIGMCESIDPAGAVWEDKGFVTCSSSDRGLDYSRASTSDWSGYFYYNAIDPTYVVTDDGKHYLVHGSWHSGFSILEVNATTGKPINELGEPYAYSVSALTARYGKRIATRTPGSRWQGSEAPEIVYKDGYYYLFMAYDGLDVPYNTRVCRSTSIDGPYYGSDGANVTEGADCYPIITHPYQFNNHSGWVGIAHCAVFQDEDGDWFYASQGRLPAGTNGNDYANANMMGHVRKIRWTVGGWPVVMPERYTGVPEKEITVDEMVGKWECITLKYSYGNMQTSTDLILADDGTASGALNGSWSFNSSTNRLTVGNLTLYVEREVDWEANPREVTIVFTGLTDDSKYSLWGKKVE